MNSWDDLPNAKHIDRMIESAIANPGAWEYSFHLLKVRLTSEEFSKAWLNVYTPGFDSVRSPINRNISRPAWYVLEYSLLGLYAYKDCAYMLDSEPGELDILAKFGNKKALMMLPACIAFSKEKELA